LHRQHFLIIDDDAAERALVAYSLKDAYPESDIHQVENPDDAEKVCGERTFDCVILDYNMPQMDGLALTQKLRPLFPHLPLVLVTSVGDEMLAARALTGGVSDYIPKARINTDSIRRTIARAMHVSTQARVIEEQRNELENFAYALAHDFKQPIRQIQTFTKLISSELGAAQGEEIEQHLGFLGDAARRLGSLVDVMSQYTLLNKPPEIGPVDLNKVLAEVLASLATYISDRNGEVITGPMPPVTGNEPLMMQVLQNLIVNGLKYNKSEAPRVEVIGKAQPARCLIAVRDNGIGIEEKYLDEIFKPLARLHSAAEYAGTGLGLTLARKAIVAQGGRVWCESEVGSGSTFYIEMLAPLKPTPPRDGE
jgi:signal transduction histidine kinase